MTTKLRWVRILQKYFYIKLYGSLSIFHDCRISILKYKFHLLS